MIQSLHIKNFKTWADTGNIRLAPITVLFGNNSSGKSSIAQFLMLLKQSISLSDPLTTLFPGNNESIVNLGRPSNMIYNRDIKNILQFSYDWSLEKPLQFNNPIGTEKYNCTKILFEGSVKVRDKVSQSMEVERFLYKLYDGEDYRFSIGMEKKNTNSSKRSYQMIFDNYEAKRNTGRIWDITPPVKFFGFPDEAIAYYQNIGFARNLNTLQSKLFSTIFYLGPLRTRAERLYTWTGTNPVDVGSDGSNAVFALLAAASQNRMYNFKTKEHLRPLDAVIAKMLMQMNLIEDFKVVKIAEERQEYEVKVKTKGSGVWTDVPDVGFGVSQVMPVLVELFYAPIGATILMEQPELHLHPSAQAALADVMISAIKAREDAKQRNIQLIIETHSEHFLRRLQRRIAEGDVDSSKVCGYFVNTTDIPVTLEPLQIDLFGNIINWPEGFFGDIDLDIYSQAKAALRRKMDE